jgi:hypothetical protein
MLTGNECSVRIMWSKMLGFFALHIQGSNDCCTFPLDATMWPGQWNMPLRASCLSLNIIVAYEKGCGHCFNK